MTVDENIDNLFDLSGKPLFDELEKILKIKIPEVLRNILELNDVNTASVISRLDENYICKIESFMRNNFNADMVPAGKQKVDFLGQKFEKNQKHFEFSVGQRIVLTMMYEFSSKNCHENLIVRTTGHTNNAESKESPLDTDVRSHLSAEEQEKQKVSNLKLLFRTLRNWICNCKNLSQIASSQLRFAVVRGSYALNSDGRVVCDIKCPVEDCDETFEVHLKTYRNYYMPTKKAPVERAGQSKWLLFRLQHHINNLHSDDVSISEENDDVTSEENDEIPNCEENDIINNEAITTYLAQASQSPRTSQESIKKDVSKSSMTTRKRVPDMRNKSKIVSKRSRQK